MISPVKARAGKSQKALGSMSKPAIIACISSPVIVAGFARGNVEVLEAEEDSSARNGAEDLGEDARAARADQAEEAGDDQQRKARGGEGQVTSTMIEASQRGEEKIAIQSRGGPSRPA